MESVVLEKHLWVIPDDLVKADDLEKAAVRRDEVRRRSDMVKVVRRTFIVEVEFKLLERQRIMIGWMGDGRMDG